MFAEKVNYLARAGDTNNNHEHPKVNQHPYESHKIMLGLTANRSIEI